MGSNSTNIDLALEKTKGAFAASTNNMNKRTDGLVAIIKLIEVK